MSRDTKNKKQYSDIYSNSANRSWRECNFSSSSCNNLSNVSGDSCSSSSSDGSLRCSSVSLKTVFPEIDESGSGNALIQFDCAKLEGVDKKVADEAYKVDEHFRKKLKDKLTVEFKTELPSIETGLIEGNPKFLWMPHFMPVEPNAYEEETFKNAISQDDLKDEESRDAFITKLKTTVRWRESQDKSTGELYKESNARIVRWSDGSETFHVGAEAFDVVQHPVSNGQNQLYVRLGNYYQPQCPIKEKLTLRPKLESNFGQSHVQGLRKRAFYKPINSCVKVLMDLNTNPVLDRERKVKEEQAQVRKEKCEKRREQKNQRKPCVKPMRHCTADDTDVDMPMQPNYNDNDHNQSNANSIALSENRRSLGIRTNRNTDFKPILYEDESDTDTDEEDTETDSCPPDDDYEFEEPPKPTKSKSILNQNINKHKRKRKQTIFSDSE